MQKREAGRNLAGSLDTAEMLSTDVEVRAKSVPGPPEVHLADVAVSAALGDARPRGGGPLTARQVEVLELLARGRTNPQIASELVLSTGTVRTHVQRIISRLGVSDRTCAVVKGIELGLIEAKARD